MQRLSRRFTRSCHLGERSRLAGHGREVGGRRPQSRATSRWTSRRNPPRNLKQKSKYNTLKSLIRTIAFKRVREEVTGKFSDPSLLHYLFFSGEPPPLLAYFLFHTTPSLHYFPLDPLLPCLFCFPVTPPILFKWNSPKHTRG